jgi:hypothetical protein
MKHLQHTSETLETYACNMRFQRNVTLLLERMKAHRCGARRRVHGAPVWATRLQIVRGRGRRRESGGGRAHISRSPPRGVLPYLDLTLAAASQHSLAVHSGGGETEG